MKKTKKAKDEICRLGPLSDAIKEVGRSRRGDPPKTGTTKLSEDIKMDIQALTTRYGAACVVKANEADRIFQQLLDLLDTL